MRATDNTTLHPLSAAARPVCPCEAAIMTAGMIDTERVNRRRKKGFMRQSIAPSQTS